MKKILKMKFFFENEKIGESKKPSDDTYILKAVHAEA